MIPVDRHELLFFDSMGAVERLGVGRAEMACLGRLADPCFLHVPKTLLAQLHPPHHHRPLPPPLRWHRSVRGPFEHGQLQKHPPLLDR